MEQRSTNYRKRKHTSHHCDPVVRSIIDGDDDLQALRADYDDASNDADDRHPQLYSVHDDDVVASIATCADHQHYSITAAVDLDHPQLLLQGDEEDDDEKGDATTVAIAAAAAGNSPATITIRRPEDIISSNYPCRISQDQLEISRCNRPSTNSSCEHDDHLCRTPVKASPSAAGTRRISASEGGFRRNDGIMNPPPAPKKPKPEPRSDLAVLINRRANPVYFKPPDLDLFFSSLSRSK